MEIDEKDLDKIRKIRPLFDSPAVGEANAARDGAQAILLRYGKTLDDITLGGTDVKKPSPMAWDLFAGYDDWMEKQEPGDKERMQIKKAKRAREAAAYRTAVISKYGSEEAAKAPVHFEQAVDGAAAPFRRFEMKSYTNGIFETETLDGWDRCSGKKDPGASDHVRHAVEGAIPLPTTIVDAKVEYDLWRERNRELEAVWNDVFGDNHLSLACTLRQNIIADLIATGLRAQTIDDVIVRHRYLMDYRTHAPDIEQGILADLEHLACMDHPVPDPAPKPATDPVQTGHHKTATERRYEVISMLVNFETGDLPDREIARRVGVSPQTVGNIRRRISAR